METFKVKPAFGLSTMDGTKANKLTDEGWKLNIQTIQSMFPKTDLTKKDNEQGSDIAAVLFARSWLTQVLERPFPLNLSQGALQQCTKLEGAVVSVLSSFEKLDKLHSLTADHNGSFTY